jgi:hypothetical protein
MSFNIKRQKVAKSHGGWNIFFLVGEHLISIITYKLAKDYLDIRDMNLAL